MDYLQGTKYLDNVFEKIARRPSTVGRLFAWDNVDWVEGRERDYRLFIRECKIQPVHGAIARFEEKTGLELSVLANIDPLAIAGLFNDSVVPDMTCGMFQQGYLEGRIPKELFAHNLLLEGYIDNNSGSNVNSIEFDALREKLYDSLNRRHLEYRLKKDLGLSEFQKMILEWNYDCKRAQDIESVQGLTWRGQTTCDFGSLNKVPNEPRQIELLY